MLKKSILTMKYHEMPMRLRDMLPVFEVQTFRGDSEFAMQVEGMAEFLGKQPRTIRSYLSYSRHERTISTEDYQKLAIEFVRRKTRRNVHGLGRAYFVVNDHNGDQLYETVYLWQAVYLADVDQQAGGWEAYEPDKCKFQLRSYDDAMQRRGRLRRLVRNDILSKKTICEVMEFDLYCLVDYQIEGVDWRSTPDETKLQTLERMQASMI